MADTNQILKLAAIIREVDGDHSKGAAALAESILNHPDFRAALADGPAVPQGREPAAVTGQPSDGEVAELVAWLREQLHVCLQAPWTPGIKHFGRAAELLERLSPPQPVPVSERPPGPEDCDAAGRCWWHRYTPTPEWHLRFGRTGQHNHWLTAHALPLPESE